MVVSTVSMQETTYSPFITCTGSRAFFWLKHKSSIGSQCQKPRKSAIYVCFQVLFLNTERAKKVKETLILKTLFPVWKVILYSSKIFSIWKRQKCSERSGLPCSLQRPLSISQQHTCPSQPCSFSHCSLLKVPFVLLSAPQGSSKGSEVPPRGFLVSTLVLSHLSLSLWLACWDWQKFSS